MKKKLYRSEKDRKVCGVCGGLADFFNIDSTIVRLLFLFLFFAYGAGLFFYIAAALIIPNESDIVTVIKTTKKRSKKEDD